MKKQWKTIVIGLLITCFVAIQISCSPPPHKDRETGEIRVPMTIRWHDSNGVEYEYYGYFPANLIPEPQPEKQP